MKYLIVFGLCLLFNTAIAQISEEDAMKFEKELKDSIAINDETFQQVISIQFDLESKEYYRLEREKEVKKKARVENTINELQVVDSITASNNYQLLDSLHKQGHFKNVAFLYDSIKNDANIEIPSSIIDFIDSTDYYIRLKAKHQFIVIDDFELTIDKSIQVPSVNRFKDKKDEYASLLLKLINKTLIENKKVLKITMKQYEVYESSKKLKTIDSIISFRYQFLIFCNEEANK